MSSVITTNIPAAKSSAPRFYELTKDCEAVADMEPGDTRKTASLLLKMSLRYYYDVLDQAQKSFYAALVAASVGTLFFLYAGYQMMHQDSVSNAKFSLLAGALVQVISGINFYFYSRASRQFIGFHICLERANRFLLANTLSENIASKDRKDTIRTELIRIVANAPLLTLDVISNGAPQQEIAQSSWKAVRASDNGYPTKESNKEAVEINSSQFITDGKS